MEIEQKERERIEQLAHAIVMSDPFPNSEGIKSVMYEVKKRVAEAAIIAEHIHAHDDVIHPLRITAHTIEKANDTLRAHVSKLEAENKALREELGNTMASVEQYGAVPEKQNLINHQLLTKNVVKPGDAELNATTDL